MQVAAAFLFLRFLVRLTRGWFCFFLFDLFFPCIWNTFALICSHFNDTNEKRPGLRLSQYVWFLLIFFVCRPSHCEGLQTKLKNSLRWFCFITFLFSFSLIFHVPNFNLIFNGRKRSDDFLCAAEINSKKNETKFRHFHLLRVDFRLPALYFASKSFASSRKIVAFG